MTTVMNQEHALTDTKSLLQNGLNGLGLDIPESAKEALLGHLRLLEKWNQTYNLTAVRELHKMVSLHLLDSLAVTPFVPDGPILDVGSGAGFPGIPLALVCPRTHVTLLDSSHKKAAFLRQVVAELDIRNASVACDRIERWGAPQPFRAIVSRAFSGLPEFVSAASRLMAHDGMLMAMKGLYPYEELQQLPAGFQVKNVVPLHVPGLDAQRHLVLIERA